MNESEKHGDYHMRLLCSESRLSLTVIRYRVEHCVLHEDADSSTYEGGEEVNVDVIACAVQAPKCVGRGSAGGWPHVPTPQADRAFEYMASCLLEVAEDGDCHQQGCERYGVAHSVYEVESLKHLLKQRELVGSRNMSTFTLQVQ